LRNVRPELDHRGVFFTLPKAFSHRSIVRFPRPNGTHAVPA
jgi:hypothetical protein